MMRDLDEYIGSQVLLLNRDGIEVLCKVKGRKCDSNGTPIGIYNSNPILNTRIFQVERPNRHIEEYVTNVIAESLLSNVDKERFDIGWIDEVVDHWKRDSALSTLESSVTTETTTKAVITTKGWDIQLKWKDGSVDWMPLSQVKEAISVELAEYAVA